MASIERSSCARDGRKRAVVAAASLIIGVHIIALVYGAWIHTPSIDEYGHLAAGAAVWKFSDFDYYRVNPPLTRLLGGLWQGTMSAPYNWWRGIDSPDVKPEFTVGLGILQEHGIAGLGWYPFLARVTCIPLSVVGAIAVFQWSRRLFGARSGLLSLMLWCSSPNVLAHAQTLVPDGTAAAMAVAATYAYWKWLQHDSVKTTLMAALLLGIALLCKFTLLVLLLAWPAIFVVSVIDRRSHVGATRSRMMKFAMIGVGAVVVVDVGYQFEGAFRKLGEFDFRSESLGGPGVSIAEPGNRFRSGILASVPVPVPENYLLGIDAIKSEFEHPEPSFAMSSWRDHGSWWYYLYGTAIKTPVGALAIIAMGLLLVARSSMLRITDKACLLVPPAMVFALVSANTGINDHLRYVLPAVPFLHVAAGATLAELRSRRLQLTVIGLATWAAVSSLWIYPHSLSYFNEFVGGPKNGHWHLLLSNVEWGQDDGMVAEWLREHADAQEVCVVLSMGKRPKWFGIQDTLDAPWIDIDQPHDDNRSLSPGLYVVSVNALHGDPYQIVRLARQGMSAPSTGYQYFSGLPAEMLGYGYRVFRIDRPTPIGRGP